MKIKKMLLAAPMLLLLVGCRPSGEAIQPEDWDKIMYEGTSPEDIESGVRIVAKNDIKVQITATVDGEKNTTSTDTTSETIAEIKGNTLHIISDINGLEDFETIKNDKEEKYCFIDMTSKSPVFILLDDSINNAKAGGKKYSVNDKIYYETSEIFDSSYIESLTSASDFGGLNSGIMEYENYTFKGGKYILNEPQSYTLHGVNVSIDYLSIIFSDKKIYSMEYKASSTYNYSYGSYYGLSTTNENATYTYTYGIDIPTLKEITD